MLGYVQKYNCLPAKPTVSSTEKYEYKILSVLIQFIHLLNTAHVLSRIKSPGNKNLKEAQSLSFKAQKTRIKINSYSVHEREQCNPAGAGAALIEFLPLLEDPYKRVKERTLSQSAAEPLLSYPDLDWKKARQHRDLCQSLLKSLTLWFLSGMLWKGLIKQTAPWTLKS